MFAARECCSVSTHSDRLGRVIACSLVPVCYLTRVAIPEKRDTTSRSERSTYPREPVTSTLLFRSGNTPRCDARAKGEDSLKRLTYVSAAFVTIVTLLMCARGSRFYINRVILT